MEIIIWILFGAFIGWVASLIMGGGGGLIWDILLGIFGSVLGGSLMSLFGIRSGSGINFYSFIVALFGACMLIYFIRLFKSQSTS